MSRTEGDAGFALAAVLSLLALGMLLSSMILASVVSGLATTSSTRAGVQSQVSADAGSDVVESSLKSGQDCTATFTSTVAPKYSATVSYTTDASVTAATSWIPGCPTVSARFVKVVSTGTAVSLGVAGNTSGNSSAIETIYTRPLATSTTSTTDASGPAVYAYSSQGFEGSGTLVSADGTNDANVMVKTGNVTCSGAGATSGDLVVNNGNLTLSGSCNVSGNVWVNGDSSHGILALSGSATVGGNVVAQGVNVSGSNTVGNGIWSTRDVVLSGTSVGAKGGGGITATNGNVTLNGSNTVKGSLWSSKNISITNGDTVRGAAVAQNITLNGGDITGQAFAKYGVTGVTWYEISGSIVGQTVTSGMQARGGVTTYPAGTPAQPSPPAAPGAPTVPAWIEFSYAQSDWAGFGLFTIPAGSSCSSATLQAAEDSFGGQKGVIDARNCRASVTLGGSDTLSLANDTAIISTKGFQLGQSGSFSSLGALKLWLITPDPSALDGVPTTTGCRSANTVFDGAFSSSKNISIMVYTPCQVNVGSSITFTGQIFAGKTTIDGAAYLKYAPVGLPGWNASTGTRTTVTTGPAVNNDWSLVSRRNISG